MINVTPAVQDVLDSGSAWFADLYTFTLMSGAVLRYTSADAKVDWDGQTWLSATAAGAPLITRGSITFEAGLAVDQLELDIATDSTMLVGGLTWPAAIRAGLFDGASVSLNRAVGALNGPVAGIIPRFAGKVGPTNPGRGSSKMVVESLLAHLRAPVPRNTYQPSCANTLYDAACGLARSARETTVTVASVSADGLTIGLTGSLTAAAFEAGFARPVTGPAGNTGQQVTIKSNTVNSLLLLYPFPVALSQGDQIAIAPGCQKTLAACTAYANTARFRGHPHVPVPETVL